MRHFQIGDHVWFDQTWVGLTSGTITSIEEIENRRTGTKGTFARIHADNGGDSGAKINRIWATKEEGMKAMKAESDAAVKKYKDSIKDVNDLVRFMYDNTVSSAEEYTNWEARQAARERAKELLGIDL